MTEEEKWIEDARPAIEEGTRLLKEKGPSLARYREALMSNSQPQLVDQRCVSRRTSSINKS